MLKKRLIFILFFQNGYFHLSRNFRLQKVGDSKWLIDKFKFSSIGDFIDELVVIDVSRERSSIENLDNPKFIEYFEKSMSNSRNMDSEMDQIITCLPIASFIEGYYLAK